MYTFAACSCEFQSTPPVKAATPLQQRETHRKLFQSTPPVKAATENARGSKLRNLISIHAAREGGDALSERA